MLFLLFRTVKNLQEEDDHNISNNINIALQRSVDFFDKHLK